MRCVRGRLRGVKTPCLREVKTLCMREVKTAYLRVVREVETPCLRGVREVETGNGCRTDSDLATALLSDQGISSQYAD